MPGITFTYEDFCKLLGKRFSKEQFEKLLPYAKAELDAFLSEEVEIDYNDTNQPYLWSVEGLARLLKGIVGVEAGIAKVSAKKAKECVVVDKKLKDVRPYIACFLARGPAINEYVLKQLIQLQEKLCDNFGRRRKKVSIGVYPASKIAFPVQFKAMPKSTTFRPLDAKQDMSIAKILEHHPKGKEFAHILEGAKGYPVLMDANKHILSLAPIINSEDTGRVKEGEQFLFFDATGTDEESVDLVANIFAHALADRGFSLEACTIDYGDRTVETPTLKTQKIEFDRVLAQKTLGIDLSESEVKKLLERMRYQYVKGMVTIPSYRHDVMHVLDVIEDVGISYGYDNLGSLPLDVATIGARLPGRRRIDLLRGLWAGHGYQEVFSAILSNKPLLSERMRVSPNDIVEIKNYMSETYSVVRSWLLPILLDVLGKNKHVDYPQRLFEQGIVSKHGKVIVDEEHLAAVSAHSSASYTELRQHVEAVLRVSGYEVIFEPLEWGCFIPGRAARVMVRKTKIGMVGEIHPAVLEEFNLLVPVAACELNISALEKLKTA